jgi:hypothetical protein
MQARQGCPEQYLLGRVIKKVGTPYLSEAPSRPSKNFSSSKNFGRKMLATGGGGGGGGVVVFFRQHEKIGKHFPNTTLRWQLKNTIPELFQSQCFRQFLNI